MLNTWQGQIYEGQLTFSVYEEYATWFSNSGNNNIYLCNVLNF